LNFKCVQEQLNKKDILYKIVIVQAVEQKSHIAKRAVPLSSQSLPLHVDRAKAISCMNNISFQEGIDPTMDKFH